MAYSEQPPAASRGVVPTPAVPNAPSSLKTAAGGSPARPLQQPLALSGGTQGRPVPPSGHTQDGSQSRRLWLAVHLPVLPLDACYPEFAQDGGSGAAPGGLPAVPRAVYEEQQGMRRILLADRAARNAGVSAGLLLNAALALLPALELRARDSLRETRLLRALAAWAERFTPLVSLEPPDGLLLEIAGSLKLFGGRETLRREIEAGLAGQGLTVSLAMAPTPLAALWLARSGRPASVLHRRELAAALARLPLACLQWPSSVCESLQGMGIRSAGDCLRLPRADFARRFGTARLMQLDRALGRLPDPRIGFRAPERFCREYEFVEAHSDRECLLAACRCLLEQLERFLVARQVAVQHLRFSFFHLERAATFLTVGGLEPVHTAGHWWRLLEMKFDRLSLPEPAIAVRLRTGRTQALQTATAALPFTRTAGQKPVPPVTHLMERLAARIGEDCVHGVTAVAEHRPQYAWRTVRANGNRISQCDPSGSGRCPQTVPQPVGGHSRRTGSLVLRRPLWMLAEPLRLAVEREVPQYRGPLRLEDGPERLETGWWDEHGIARDYFVAVNPEGAEFWIYRCRRAGWYLHGLFS